MSAPLVEIVARDGGPLKRSWVAGSRQSGQRPPFGRLGAAVSLPRWAGGGARAARLSLPDAGPPGGAAQ